MAKAVETVVEVTMPAVRESVTVSTLVVETYRVVGVTVVAVTPRHEQALEKRDSTLPVHPALM